MILLCITLLIVSAVAFFISDICVLVTMLFYDVFTKSLCVRGLIVEKVVHVFFVFVVFVRALQYFPG